MMRVLGAYLCLALLFGGVFLAAWGYFEYGFPQRSTQDFKRFTPAQWERRHHLLGSTLMVIGGLCLAGFFLCWLAVR